MQSDGQDPSPTQRPRQGPDQGAHQGPVLVPVDFSPPSAAALVWAARLCERLGAPLQVLHVVHDPESAPGSYTEAQRGDQLHRMAEAAATMMDAFLLDVAQAHPDVALLKGLSPLLLEGLPVTRILETAESLDARQIAMGSQGRTGLPHLLLGSKAERVAQLAPMPVTIIKGPSPEPARADG